LDKLAIPRRPLSSSWFNIQLHGFCDASQEAYGACIYARTQNSNGEFETSLYVSKSRVAPLHATTIPRLELCGAVLLSDLTNEVISELKKLNITLHQHDIVLWSDSTVVIAWINSTQPLKSYVSNRIAQILDHTDKTQKNQKGVLTVNKLQNARNVWLRYAQHDEFRSELNSLTESKPVRSNSRLKRLNPFIDTVGLIRVGDRLDYLVASEERRHPVILPPKGKIVKMIFEQMHVELLHIGPQGLLANIQLLYWPLRGRNLSRSTYQLQYLFPRET